MACHGTYHRFSQPGSKAEEILEQFLDAFALPEVVAKLATRCLPQAGLLDHQHPDGKVLGFDFGTLKKQQVASQRLVMVSRCGGDLLRMQHSI